MMTVEITTRLSSLGTESSNMTDVHAVIESMPMFGSLSPSAISTLVASLHETLYGTGDVIIREGEHGDSFFIIKSGGYDDAPSNPDTTSFHHNHRSNLSFAHTLRLPLTASVAPRAV
eukprot:4060548-Prymnesium_polylepis.1